MAIKKGEATYQKVFNDINRVNAGKPNSRMKPVMIKMYPEERKELERIFNSLGYSSFASGVRIALTEFKKKHI